MTKRTPDNNNMPIEYDSTPVVSPSFARRRFIGAAGTSVGFVALGGFSALGLSACGGGGGGDGGIVTPTPTPTPVDPIWDITSPAGKIIDALKNIKQSSFKNVDYDVTGYGAAQCTVVAQSNAYTSTQSTNANKTVFPGSFDSRPAFLAAIAACNAGGGGRVVVPAGNWYCAGPIVLLSNVNFHLSADCTIYFSPNPADYAKDGPVNCGANGKLYYSRWQGDDCINFGSPIYAFKQNNIAITGADPKTSILNGQAMTPFAGSGNTATCWWTYKGTSKSYGVVDGNTPSQVYTNPNNVDLKVLLPTIDAALYAKLTSGTPPWQRDENYLPALSEAGIPLAQRIFGIGHYLRPCMVEFMSCTNVLMEGYQTNNTPFWQHHPVACTNVVIRNVLVQSIGPNGDGFDPDACTTVLCEDMTFNTGDDCIAIKSGKNLDTQYGPAQDHVIQNCTMNSGHGGITLGSEMSAGIQNVYARNLTMLNENWESDPLNIAIRIKTNMNRGGYVKNVYIDGVTLPNGLNLKGSGVASSSQGGVITFECNYSAASDAIRTRPPTVQNFNISNVKVSNVTKGAVTASCYQAIVAKGPVAADYNGPAPTPTIIPISGVTITNCDFGTPIAVGPASATVAGPIYAYNVKDITLKNVLIAGKVYDTVVVDVR